MKVKDKTKSSRSKRTCFISASPDTRISDLISVLRSLGVQPAIASDFGRGGTKPSDIIAEAISGSDFVIGILEDASSNANVLFELGYAHALQKPLLIQTAEGVRDVPSDLRGFLYVRRGKDEPSEALRFAIQQLISAPKTTKRRKSVLGKSKAIGGKADELLQQLDTLKPVDDYAALEAVIRDALQASGISAYAQSGTADQRVDFAVWVDDIESLVGNPIVIEVKSRLSSTRDARAVRDQLLHYLNTTNSRTGVVLYAEGPESQFLNQSAGLPNVLFMQVRELLSRLRTQGFGTILADLRNKLVHGGAY